MKIHAITALGLGGLLLLPGGCIEDPDCGICDPHNLVLQSISGVNYASRKVHLLGPECEGPECPGPITEGRYFIERLGPCEQSEDALESVRGPQEYCKLSPLVTAYGIEFVFNNLLDASSVELVRKRPDNPQLYEVYDWKTQILSIEGPITRYNGDFVAGASGGDPDTMSRMVNLSCIDNLRDQGRTFSHLDYADPAQNPCNAIDPATGQPMKLRVDGTITATRGLWEDRTIGDAAVHACSTPDEGPDTCCSECDLALTTRVAKYGVLGNVDPGSGAVLQGPDLLARQNQRRPADGSAIACDVNGDPFIDCRDFIVGTDRSKETLRYQYHWSCDPADPGCERESFAVPRFDRIRELHPDDRPSWVEARTRSCTSTQDCIEGLGSYSLASMCVGQDEQGRTCWVDAGDSGCTGGTCVAPWTVTCRSQPDTTGGQGYCVDQRFDDKAAGGCLVATGPLSICDEEGENCRTVDPQQSPRLVYCDADEDGRLLAEECCQQGLGGEVFDEEGELACDPAYQPQLRPVPRADRNRFLPEVTRDCLCTDFDDAPRECRDAVAATCVDEDGRVLPERAGQYAVKLVSKRGGVIYDPAIKGLEWQPADSGGIPRAAIETCAESRALIPRRTVHDGWLGNSGFSRRVESFEDFDRAMCSGQRYTVAFQTPGDGEHVRDKRGNTLLGRSTYTFETSHFHVVPQSGFPPDNLRIGACDEFDLTFSNKVDLSPENLAKIELWRIDEQGQLVGPQPSCDPGPVAGGPACAATEDERKERGTDCVPPCLTVDVSRHLQGTLQVAIDPTEFGAVLEPGARYRMVVPGLDDISQMNDPTAYRDAFWDACGMPLVNGVEGSDAVEYTYDFDIDEPKCREDLDLDGLQFSCDNAQDVYNRDQSDVDRDGVGDVIDLCPVVPSASTNSGDSDDDGVGNDCDNCRQTLKQYNDGADDLGVPYYMLARNIPFQDDADRDGIGDVCDNCITVANCDGYGPDDPYQVGDPIAFDDAGRCQRDDDSDRVGDACQGTTAPEAAGVVGFGDADDFDQDGITNFFDACPRQPLPDGLTCESDAQCPANRRCEKLDPGDETGRCDHVDTDNDGFGDICDTCPFAANPMQLFDGVEQAGDADGDFIGDECEPNATCEERNDPRPMAFHRVSSSGYCCTTQLRVEADGTLTSLVTGRTLTDPDDVLVRIDCTEAQEDARECRRLPDDVSSMPGVLDLPPGCEEALAEAGLSGPEDNPPVQIEDLGGDLIALWDFMCLLPPRDQDHDGVGDICDLCDFAWDPENLSFIDANGRVWPNDGAFCNGDYSADAICEQQELEDPMAGTGTGTGTGDDTGGSSGTDG